MTLLLDNPEVEPELIDWVEVTRNWTQEAKAKAAAEIKRRIDPDRHVWYCTDPGPNCDGHPHAGYEYEHARSDQWPPLDRAWFVWLLSGGRGSGKTRSGSEYIRKATQLTDRINLIGVTSADVRDTMIEGVSGLEKVCADVGEPINYEPSKRKITFANGCIAKTFSAEEPDRLRGPQAGVAWLDEPAHMPLINDVWDNMLFGLRMGTRPRVVLTTTPRPTKWLKKIIADKRTRTVRVSTSKNRANLPQSFLETMDREYAGTRKGRQELDGEVLEEVEGALWDADMLQGSWIPWEKMERIVVGVDPAGTTNTRSDETGIVIVGKIGDTAYVLADRSGKYSPKGWADAATGAYEFYKADAIVAEKNFGGDMVKSNLQSTQSTARVIVTTSTRSKALRAEPIVGLYEQKRVKHNIPGDVDEHEMVHNPQLSQLEDEMLTWVPDEGKSPNRVDALVFAITELIKPGGPASLGDPRGKLDPKPATSSIYDNPNGLVLPLGYTNPWNR